LNEPVFLLHVPKAAGLSINALVKESFSDSEICPTPPDLVWRRAALDGYRFYSGHFSFDFIREFGRGTSLIMLRHPVARVVSLYDYWRSYSWNYLQATVPTGRFDGRVLAKSVSFSEFLDAPLTRCDVSNQIARLLLGAESDTLLRDHAAAISRAVSILRSFDWVGVTDLFKLSVITLCTLLGRPKAKKLPRANLTYQRCREEAGVFERVKKTRPTTSQRRRILELNQVDAAIYHAGRAMLLERAAEISQRPEYQTPGIFEKGIRAALGWRRART
jgi:Sulfotransferase family